MTEIEREICLAFGQVTFPMMTKRKAFAHSMIHLAKYSPEVDLSIRQKRYIALLARQFKNQMPERLHFQIEVMRAVYDKASPEPEVSMALARDIHGALSAARFDLTDEKRLQNDMYAYLLPNFPKIEREYRLSGRDIIDFKVDRVGIEVKVKGSARQIYNQLCRYSNSPEVDALLLATNKALGMPKEINSKPVFVLNLGFGWL